MRQAGMFGFEATVGTWRSTRGAEQDLRYLGGAGLGIAAP
jgi:hypothetical protein